MRTAFLFIAGLLPLGCGSEDPPVATEQPVGTTAVASVTPPGPDLMAPPVQASDAAGNATDVGAGDNPTGVAMNDAMGTDVGPGDPVPATGAPGMDDMPAVDDEIPTDTTDGTSPDVGDGMSSSDAMGTDVLAPDCAENIACTLDVLEPTGDVHQDCVNRINQFRTQCACLPPLTRWVEGESCADEQAEYDSTRTAHAGFNAGICDGGSGQNECPGWRSTDQVITGCLQSMWDEGPPPTDPCDGQCFQDHGHFINMTGNFSQVACGFFETPDGELWAVQNFAR